MNEDTTYMLITVYLLDYKLNLWTYELVQHLLAMEKSNGTVVRRILLVQHDKMCTKLDQKVMLTSDEFLFDS